MAGVRGRATKRSSLSATAFSREVSSLSKPSGNAGFGPAPIGRQLAIEGLEEAGQGSTDGARAEDAGLPAEKGAPLILRSPAHPEAMPDARFQVTVEFHDAAVKGQGQGEGPFRHLGGIAM